LRTEDFGGIRTHLVEIRYMWQLAFEIQHIEGGKIVVFSPGAPDPWSGSVGVVTEDRITPLDLTVKSAAGIMKRLGKGSTEALPDPLSFNESSV
jgi:uncharacterized membrane protein